MNFFKLHHPQQPSKLILTIKGYFLARFHLEVNENYYFFLLTNVSKFASIFNKASRKHVECPFIFNVTTLKKIPKNHWVVAEGMKPLEEVRQTRAGLKTWLKKRLHQARTKIYGIEFFANLKAFWIVVQKANPDIIFHPKMTEHVINFVSSNN